MTPRTILAAIVLSAMMAGLAAAQPERPERGERGERFQRGGGGGGGGERFDPAQIRQRIEENLRQQIGASDLEWEVIQPKLERVTTAQQNATVGRLGGLAMMAGGRGPGAAAAGERGRGRTESELAAAARELRTALQAENASEEEIASRLAAFRAAREKANEELKEAQQDLRDVLTERQEAVLVMLGLLE